ncbi:hypothetical protein L479_00998 [Exiguobacterium sp. S17]|nr:hypothetical protein L479_00998 [Exiguobacterium sp. S17]
MHDASPLGAGRADTPRRRSFPPPWRGFVTQRCDCDDDWVTVASQSILGDGSHGDLT